MNMVRVSPEEVQELRITLADRDAVALVTELLALGFAADDVLDLVEFPPWPGEWRS